MKYGYGKFIFYSGVFLIIVGLTSLTVYYASMSEPMLNFYKVVSLIIIVLSIISIFFDEDTGNFLGGFEPLMVRGVGFANLLILTIVSFLIGSAIKWIALIRLIQIIFGVLVAIIVLGTVAFFYLKTKHTQGNQNGYSNIRN